MNKQVVLCVLGFGIFSSLAGCDQFGFTSKQQKPAPAPVAAPPVAAKAPDDVLRETLSQEIAQTQQAIDDAMQAQQDIEGEIALMKQLIDDTEKDLKASEAEVARLEALNKTK